jgi:hypothetical protein
MRAERRVALRTQLRQQQRFALHEQPERQTDIDRDLDRNRRHPKHRGRARRPGLRLCDEHDQQPACGHQYGNAGGRPDHRYGGHSARHRHQPHRDDPVRGQRHRRRQRVGLFRECQHRPAHADDDHRPCPRRRSARHRFQSRRLACLCHGAKRQHHDRDQYGDERRGWRGDCGRPAGQRRREPGRNPRLRDQQHLQLRVRHQHRHQHRGGDGSHRGGSERCRRQPGRQVLLYRQSDRRHRHPVRRNDQYGARLDRQRHADCRPCDQPGRHCSVCEQLRQQQCRDVFNQPQAPGSSPPWAPFPPGVRRWAQACAATAAQCWGVVAFSSPTAQAP